MASQKNTESGFSTLEGMIAAAIISIVAVGAASVFATQFKMAATLNEKVEILEMKRSVSQLLADSDQCRFNFSGKSLASIVDKAPVDSLQYYDESGHPLDATFSIEAGNTISTTANLGIESVFLSNVKSISAVKKKADVVVRFEARPGKLPFAPATFKNIIFTANAASIIQSCGSTVPSSIPSLAGQSCATGMYVSGIDNAGQVICDLLPTSTNVTNTIVQNGNPQPSNGAYASASGITQIASGGNASNTLTNTGSISINSTAVSNNGGPAVATASGIRQVASSTGSGSATNTFTNTGSLTISATASSTGGH